ncbi:unnamed protein product [Leptosia nina]|uniref:Hemolin n=1 Tax=Leptosia nina TaxID=320188 RepID=A0AAV1IZY2_9NEOP
MFSVVFLMLMSNTFVSSTADNDGKSSLVFVFDTTMSMANDLRQLRAGAEMILKTALEDSNVIADFVFVPFHDPGKSNVGPATVTRDKQVFKSALQVRVYGGGDCPEMSLGGILLALNVSRPQSYVYVFTDATASDHKLVGSVLDLVQRKQSQVVFILTGHCNDLHKPTYKVYQQIAAASSGQIFNLKKNSVYKVLEFVRTSIKNRAVNLASAINPAGYNHTQKIPVDSTVDEVTVSVSGAKPNIRVVNPSGKEITGPPQLITTLDLSEIMIIKVLEPEPGNWSITVGSTVEHSVKVVGLSNLTFDHGFSILPPTSMADTSYRPLQGTYNHMMVSLSKIDIPIEITFAEILDLEGRSLFEVPLKVFNTREKLFIADAFVPPDEMFYVSINGFDENGQELRRVGGTAVQAKPPDVPYLNVPQKIEAHLHEQVILTCKVESLVPVTAGWFKDGKELQPTTSSLQSTSIQYMMQDMSEFDIGMYQCNASNIAGTATAETVLDLIVEPPQVSVLPLNSTVPVGTNLTITCSVFSEVLLSKTSLIFNGSKLNYEKTFKLSYDANGIYTLSSIIDKVTEHDQGVFTCMASNKGGTTNTSTHITVQLRPLAHILGPHTLTRRAHTHVQFVCCVENALEMYWVDPNDLILNKIMVNGSYNAMLDISDVKDDGVWKCVAVHNNYTVSDSIKLHVLIKPEVKIDGPSNITVLNGTVVQVICTIIAKPAPRILWHMETERFLPNEVTMVSANTYKSVLTLDSTKELVNGTYFCFGENAEGIDQDSINVEVRRKMILLKGFNDSAVDLYSKVELLCVVDGYPPPRITWYHNNTIILQSTLKESTMLIERVDFDDLGAYSCVADNGYEVLEVNATLMVKNLEPPLLKKEPLKRVSEKGKSAILTCRLLKGNPKPTLSWKYKSYNSSRFTALPAAVDVNEDDLNISRTSMGHGGFYQCTAENVIGKDYYTVELIVQYPPVFNNPQSIEEPKKIKLGEKLQLGCNVSGNPPPMVVWTKDYQAVAFSRNIYLVEGDLVINNMTENEQGVYVCEAISQLGAVQRNFTINAFQTPAILSSNNNEKEVLEGQLVEFPCSAQGLPPPFVKWLHNENLISERRKHIDDYGLRFVANLTDFGEYSCVASNEHGTDTFNYTLYVWVAPSIEPPLEVTLNVLPTTNITLNCDAIGFPLPHISWEFNGDILQQNDTNISFNYVGNLYIYNVSAHTEGQYTCIATNIAGAAVKQFFINVQEPPKFSTENLEEYIGIAGRDSSIILTCKVSGKPRPYVLWIKDGYYLDRDSRYEIDNEGSLTINLPAVEFSGNYTCMAKNPLGNISRTVQVHIYSLPSHIQADETLTSVKLVEGKSGSVDCPIQHADHVKWYKDAILIANNTLTFANVTRSIVGTYACVVSNMVGSAQAQVAINVLWPPSFVSQAVHENEVIKGDDCFLDCEVNANPKPRIKWLFNSNLMLDENQGKLKLLDTKLHNSGLYKCIVSNEYGTVNREFTLNVLEPPYISQFDLLDVQLKEGTNATLECTAKGIPEPKISWSYNNSHWQQQNTTLITTNLSLQSEGIFRCDATNKAGVAHLVYNVTIVSAARIKNIVLFAGGEGSTLDRVVDVTLNSNVRIACSASGNPMPVIQWLRNGNKISQNLKEVGYADLILKITISNPGVYTCVAVNEGGIEERSIRVNVLEPPRIFGSLNQDINTTSQTINLNVLSDQSFYMHCHAYGNPVPEIYWFKDGLPLKIYDDTMVSRDFGEIVEVRRAIQEHSGNYTCVARNAVGEDRLVYLIDVLVAPPQPKDNLKHLNVRTGQSLNLSCPAVGRPLPYVTWFKHPYTEIGPNDRIILTNDNYTLTINNTEVLDAGKYSCIMTNKVGTTEIIFDVIIEKPPSIAGNVGNNATEKHVVALQRSVVLKCESEGSPTPKISWLKDIQKLNENLPNIQNLLGTSLLAIWSVGTRDAGQYICVAENIAGTAHRRYNIIVQVPGKWSSWSGWSYCNVTCGLGYQRRTRICQYIDERNNTYDKTTQTGKIILDDSACKGSVVDRRKCHMPPCEEDLSQSKWSRWSRWSSCSATCGAATQMRTRRCIPPGTCSGDNIQIRKCSGLPRCYARERSTKDVFKNGERHFDRNLDYLPEATFELQPETDSGSPDPIEYDDIFPNPAYKASPFYEVNVTENLDHSERGICEAGYWYNIEDNSCIDIDECTLDANHCHATQMCSNIPGGYGCSCQEGFTSLGAGQRCLDINECEQNIARCEFACVNTAGGYVCACPKHLRLHRDRHHCVTPFEYNKPHFYEDLGEDYLSTSIEIPYKRSRGWR